MFCTSDIYRTSVGPRKKDPPSVVPPEVSYLPCLFIFFQFFHTCSKGLSAEGVTSVQSVIVCGIHLPHMNLVRAKGNKD